MQRIITRAVVAVLAAFAILTPTGYAMADPARTVPAGEKHDAQLQLVDPPEPSPTDERQVLASRGQGSPEAAEKHDAQLQDVVGRPAEPVATEKHDAQLHRVDPPDLPVAVEMHDARLQDVVTSPAADDDDGGLSTAALSALIALVAMSGIAVASVAHRHARVRV